MSKFIDKDFISGTGSLFAEYVVVGESWTTLGAKMNTPFRADSLKLLQAVLSARGIDAKTNVYYTNAVAFVPPSKVTKFFVDESAEFLKAEILKIKPKVILACGSWAFYALTGRQSILQEVRGLPVWSYEFQAYIVPTYSPSAIHFQPTLFENFAADIQKLKLASEFPVGGFQPPKPILIEVNNLEEYLKVSPKLQNPESNLIAVDIETDGFDFLNQDILSIGLGPTDEEVIILSKSACEDAEIQKLLNELFARGDITFAYQNGKFDCKFMKARPTEEGFLKPKNVVLDNARCDFDTMIAHYCLNEKQGTHGLKVWAREEFNAPDWEADIKKYLPTKDTPYSKIPPEILHGYQAYDVYYTRKGVKYFTQKMIEDETYECFKNVYVPAVKAFTEIELEGIPVNRQRLQQLYDEAQPRIKEKQDLLTEAAIAVGWDPMKYAQKMNEKKMALYKKGITTAPKNSAGVILNPKTMKPWLPPGGTEIPKEFNPRSHPQLSWVAYELCNMPLFDMGNGEKKASCNKDAVDLYRHRHPFWAALAEYKEVSDLFGTFVKGMLERIDPDDRIRPDFLLHGTKTGRISCQNPNMQNLPRRSVVKDFFVADADSVVVNVDYVTLEVVIAAILSNDQEMLKPFIEGLDFHGETARAVFGPEIRTLEQGIENKDPGVFKKFLSSKMMMEIRHSVMDLINVGNFIAAFDIIWGHLRFLTKFITFGIMYGRGAKSLAEGELNCSILEAEKYVNQFFKKYPTYAAWLNSQFNSAKKFGYVQNAFGFKRRWPFIIHSILHEIRNQSWNTPVQGTASMFCMSALCRCHEMLKETQWGRVLFTVHDSVVFSIKKKYLQVALTEIQKEMTRNILDWKAPIEVEFEIGNSYQRVQPAKFENGFWMAESPEKMPELVQIFEDSFREEEKHENLH